VLRITCICLSVLVVATAAAAGAAVRGRTQITGFGATVAVWNKHHREDRRGNLVPGCCYDPIPAHDGLQFADRYFAVQPIGGHVISYEIWTGNATTAAAAKRVALREMPVDARVRSFTVHRRSCAILILRSERLGAALHGAGGNEVIVEFSSGKSSSSYDPRSVNDLLFSSGIIAGPAAQNC
jgi:hypothetical protein